MGESTSPSHSAICRLQAFRAAGSGEQVTASSASLQRARTLLQDSPARREPAPDELPTGACWPLIPLVGKTYALATSDKACLCSQADPEASVCMPDDTGRPPTANMMRFGPLVCR